jgi:hypothetical protein
MCNHTDIMLIVLIRGEASQTYQRFRCTGYCHYALLKRLARDLDDIAADFGQFIQEEHTVVGQRHLARHRHLAPANLPHLRDRVMGAATLTVVANAVLSPVRPPTLWMHVVTMVFAGSSQAVW